jgi:dCMP deaminase
MQVNKWDQRFTRLAREVATWSKDPSTQIGAVIVNDERRVLATGYNGFPKGIADTPERYEDKEVKYETVIHAEMNAIYNATYNGISLKDSTIYVWGLPVCNDCARGIIQVGVKRVVMATAGEIPEKWVASFSKSFNLFLEAGVTTEFLQGPTVLELHK